MLLDAPVVMNMSYSCQQTAVQGGDRALADLI